MAYITISDTFDSRELQKKTNSPVGLKANYGLGFAFPKLWLPLCLILRK
jgi:hypothetical protein